MPSSVHFCTKKKVNTNLKQGRSWSENSFEEQKLLLLKFKSFVPFFAPLVRVLSTYAIDQIWGHEQEAGIRQWRFRCKKAATQFISKTTLQPKHTQNSYNMAEVYFVWKTCSQSSFLQAPISSCTWLWRPSCRRAFYIYESLFTEKYDGISLIMTLETAHGLALSERFSLNGEANRP